MGILDGKIAIITGGTSGIGARTVEVFAEEGAKVVVVGRRIAEGEAIAARLGPQVSFCQADMTQETDVKVLFDNTIGSLGRIDCLFNNAGGGGPRTAGIAEMDIAASKRSSRSICEASFSA
jgi:NAD(P)-dependent dehydrogenase (short-subunit alcohol dehydrogenase family)